MSNKTPEEMEYDLLCMDIRDLSKDKRFTKFVWHVLGFCDLYSDVFTGNSRTFYLEGRRNVGLSILAVLEDADPTLYARLLLEQQKKQEMTNG